MSRQSKSHVPRVSDLQHPMQKMSEVMVKFRAAFKDIIKETRDIAKEHDLVETPTVYDHAKLMQILKERGLYQQARAMFAEIVAAEPNGPVTKAYPRPPYANELYGRLVKGSEVLDVGSGDGKRLIQFEGQLNFKTIDAVVREVRIATDHKCEMFLTETEAVITSFNALTNNKDAQAFENSDGIHVVPDLDLLEKDGFSTKSEDGGYVTRVNDQTYHDFRYDGPVQNLRRYYHGVNTYKKRVVTIRLVEEKDGPPSMKSRGNRLTSMPLDLEGVTEKLDGELLKLVVKNGRCIVLNRAGEMRGGSSDGPDMILYLELVGDEFYLLSVDLYRTFKPFHSYGLLGKFLDRVSITLNGEGLKLPPLWDGRKEVEGVVLRTGGEDYLFRMHHSFDIHGTDTEEFFEQLERLGLVFSRIPGWLGMCEIVVEQIGTGYRLINKGVRRKAKSTKMKDVRKQMLWPTLYQFIEHIPCSINDVVDEVDEPDSDDE